jgi:transcription elongation GreA/GreB family factor
MAQALIGRGVGERVQVPTESGEHEVEVLGIAVAAR